MTNEEIDPMVPEMPRQTSTETVRADGGRPRNNYNEAETEAPLVPQL